MNSLFNLDPERYWQFPVKYTAEQKKNEIISIQEVNEFGKPIGEPIKPTNDESIVPVK